MIVNFDIFMQLNRNNVTLELPSTQKNYNRYSKPIELSLLCLYLISHLAPGYGDEANMYLQCMVLLQIAQPAVRDTL